MTRLERLFFEGATFPIAFETPIEAGHLDAHGRVNNVAVTALLQEARFDFNRRSGIDLNAGAFAAAAVSLHIEFARELHAGASVQISTGVKGISSRSYVVAQLIRQYGRSAVYAEIVLAFLHNGRAVEIPDTVAIALKRRVLVNA